MSKNGKKDGISLRVVNLWLIVGAIVISGLMLYYTFHLFDAFCEMTSVTARQNELRNAASELMDASDYLSEKVQRFTVDGDRQFMNEYFREAFEVNRREAALEKLASSEGGEEAFLKLQDAMKASLELMDREYYAMKLVVEAKGYTDCPEILDTVKLSDADAALSPEEKMQLATKMVLDEEYYSKKELIRRNMTASLSKIEKSSYSSDASALESLNKELSVMRVIIILQTCVLLLMVWLTSRLGIHPVLNAVDRIKNDSPIPEVGANEFRYLARAYNKMYDVYKGSLERLNFKASHDELTGAYNRAGYDLIMSGIDLESTYMMLIDVDNFKNINDTYGHEIGDKILVKLVNILNESFRSDDYICRIGGDEFVVIMVHTDKSQQNLIASIIDGINRKMDEEVDGLPKASISVGIVHGSDASDPENLFEKTDASMYQSKQKGKQTYTFYSEDSTK